jgi:hypothetical protein
LGRSLVCAKGNTVKYPSGLRKRPYHLRPLTVFRMAPAVSLRTRHPF